MQPAQLDAQFIASKYAPQRRERDIEQIAIVDVIAIYADDRGSEIARDNELYARLERLNNFWANRTLAEINGETCREYVRVRGNSSGARRELEDLRAAINHHSREGYHQGTVRVLLPKKGKARMRWLTRKEAAPLLRTCWQAREGQTIHRGPRFNQSVETDRRPLRHLARFILIGLYTGTRAGAIASASIRPGVGRSFVDMDQDQDQGIFYRLATGAVETKKRQPPVPLSPRLLADLRRWAAKGIIRDAVVEWNGQPVRSVRTAFRRTATPCWSGPECRAP
jgi:integrase